MQCITVFLGLEDYVCISHINVSFCFLVFLDSQLFILKVENEVGHFARSFHGDRVASSLDDFHPDVRIVRFDHICSGNVDHVIVLAPNNLTRDGNLRKIREINFVMG